MTESFLWAVPTNSKFPPAVYCTDCHSCAGIEFIKTKAGLSGLKWLYAKY